MTSQSQGGAERRKHVRIKKHFILSYYDKANPARKHDATQIKNISIGGMCIFTSVHFEPGTLLGVEMKTPYLTGPIYLEGSVLQSHERIPNVMYETRLVFENISTQAELVLKKIVEYYKNKG